MTKRITRIALVQQRAGQDRAVNVERGLKAVRAAAAKGANIICFAELAFDRFYPQNKAEGEVIGMAEPVPGPTTTAFAHLASELHVAIVLNVFEADGERTFDTSPVIDADGTLLGKTRMIHITDYPCFHETDYYFPGDRGAPVYETAFGKIGVAICYDRHYPEYMRALGVAGAEIVFIPQAGVCDEWPDGLYHAEIQVAAFQNGYFAALCNRVGREDQMEFAGESFVCKPNGEIIAAAGTLTEEILFADLDLSEVASSHARTLFYRDRRPDLYEQWISQID
ncbi:MAG: carbon-nitrogen hydrolase family protein [Rhodothermales bacterium]|nr:carbon-nitrogen hydrolase family protein [Rhodothermales bacterium]